mgnify:CR=1 FL=1
MHIRLLLMTFFLQFFPDVIRGGHLYVLQTPLFRVRNKKETHYCYSEEEKNRAVARCGANAEITRFKGLGEISPDEFRGFIGQDIRLDKVRLTKDDPIHDMLEFYMGKNTYERQGFIIGNLRIDYLHKMQRVYESEINRMQDMMDHSGNAREVAAASKRKDKLAKQLKECREYDEKISHLALSRIELDLDDGVKVNYRKLQTAQDGKFYEVLADSKNIMVKEKK